VGEIKEQLIEMVKTVIFLMNKKILQNMGQYMYLFFVFLHEFMTSK
jgi:hypothetical protein